MNEVLIQVFGRVQGVFYRAYVEKEAKNHNLTGWVKNNSDRSVTILAQGQKEKLKEFIEWCKKGSPLSKVKSVKIVWQKPTQEFKDFKITG